MQQVAAAAGVSLKTVSRVVNREPGVSAALISRVEAEVTRLGYRHNLAASQLRRGRRTASIGVLLQDLGNDFCAELLRAVEDRARVSGVVVISASLDEEADREHELVIGLVQRRIDGIILMPASQDQSYLADEMTAGLAVVIVDRHPHRLDVDSVATANHAGAREAVAHLVAQGHRRIGFVGDDPAIDTARERLEGYREALAEHGLPVLTELQRPAHGTRADAERAVVELLTLPDPPTALFTARNEVTVGAVRALRAAGLSRRVALVGFDDFANADLLDPAVTVVSQDARGQGLTAVDLLLARLGGAADPVQRVELATRLIPRGSGEIPAPTAR